MKKVPKIDPKPILSMLLIPCLVYLAMKAPVVHSDYVRKKVQAKVYKIQSSPNSGGGTGFAVTAPSGISYIVSNAHVCEAVLKETANNKVLIRDDKGSLIKRSVIDISDESDLCLIEGLPGVTGLKVTSAPDIGDEIAIVGHPLLMPLAVSRGDVMGEREVQFTEYVMSLNDHLLDAMFNTRNEKCDNPKNRIQKIMLATPFGKVKARLCTTVISDVYITNAVVYPGNSGSPAVDWYGNVVGVLFASDDRTHWGCVISNKDLTRFLRYY
jgi:S1-C subfamily serine protease